jgi:hypothetical protein
MGMELKIWIIGQLAVDVVILAVLAGVMRFHWKRRVAFEDFDAVLRKSEALLSEMTKISLSLDQNLEEKRALTSTLLSELDARVRDAGQASEAIRRMLERWEKTLAMGTSRSYEKALSRESIDALLDKGLSEEEISRHFGVSTAEVDLVMKLHGGRGREER